MADSQASTMALYLKLKKLVPFLLGLEVLDGLQQNVNSFCVANALEARLCYVPQSVLHFRVTVAIHFGGGKEFQICSASSTKTRHCHFSSTNDVTLSERDVATK